MGTVVKKTYIDGTQVVQKSNGIKRYQTLLEKFKKRLIAYGFRNGNKDSEYNSLIMAFYCRKCKKASQPSENIDGAVNQVKGSANLFPKQN